MPQWQFSRGTIDPRSTSPRPYNAPVPTTVQLQAKAITKEQEEPGFTPEERRRLQVGSITGAVANIYSYSQNPNMPVGAMIGMSASAVQQSLDRINMQGGRVNPYIQGAVSSAQQFGMGSVISSVMPKSPVWGTLISGGLGFAAGGPFGAIVGIGGALFGYLTKKPDDSAQRAASEAQKAIREQLADTAHAIGRLKSGYSEFNAAQQQLDKEWAMTKATAARNELVIAQNRASADKLFGLKLFEAERATTVTKSKMAEEREEALGATRVALSTSGFSSAGSSWFVLSNIADKAEAAREVAGWKEEAEKERLQFDYDVQMQMEQLNEDLLGLQMGSAKIAYDYAKNRITRQRETLTSDLGFMRRKGLRLKREYEYQGRLAEGKALGSLATSITSALSTGKTSELPRRIMESTLKW